MFKLSKMKTSLIRSIHQDVYDKIPSVGKIKMINLLVSIVTTVYEGEKFASTAQSLTSVCLEPCTLTFNLENNNKLTEILQSTKYASIQILTQKQISIATLFSNPANMNKFKHNEYKMFRGLPIFNDVGANFICKIKPPITNKDRSLFLAEISYMDYNIKEKYLCISGRDYIKYSFKPLWDY